MAECVRTACIRVCVLRHCITSLFRFSSLAVGGTFVGGTTVFAPEHSLQVAALPCLKRFFCDLENSVSSAVFPHNRQAAASIEDAPTFVPSVAGKLSGYTSINVIGSES